MAGSYERLSAQDSSYFRFEGPGRQAHITAIGVFEAGPLLAREGGLDVERIRTYVDSRLHLLPRYRRRLAFTPVQSQPIWVDDPNFDVACHVRHVGLPQPGTDAVLKELTGRIASEPLDRSRPLWELTFVEGMRGDRFAMIAKVHHALVDGVSGVGVLQALLSPSPHEQIEEKPSWEPQPIPSTLDFIVDGAVEGARLSASALSGVSSALSSPRTTASSMLGAVGSGLRTLQAGVPPPPKLPLNGPIGGKRRIEWQRLDLAEVRDVRKRLDGSINDVVLCTVAGAVRRLLKARRTRLRDLELRVIVPVDTRAGAADAEVANRVSAWFVNLPLGESNVLRRFQRVRTQTRRLKARGDAEGVDRFLRFADWTGANRLSG